jgi:small subunit ribosomal protein S9|uniref:Small ribosomal subunit protein uS9c n=1 Tax=Tetraselmis sp. CCMP 881 TaxID=1812852 RepID=A0A142BY46_9CHLO|nr:ribosomal protein S9 [Tetraselmis sp. CCMP 881]
MNQNSVQGIGRRKTSVAKVTLQVGTGQFSINKKPAASYIQGSIFPTRPLELFNLQTNYDTIVQVNGGGITGQVEAIQLGLARALCKLENSHRDLLKDKGFLTRDARIKERKKYGLKKARKAPQFSKR